MTRLKRWVWSLIRTSKIIKEETMCEGHHQCTKPKLKELVLYSAKISSYWKEIALQLDIPQELVNTINISNTEVKEKCYHMFQKWLESTINPCWCHFISALRKVDLNEVAREAEQNITSINLPEKLTTPIILISNPNRAVSEFTSVVSIIEDTLMKNNELLNLNAIKSICGYLPISSSSSKLMFSAEQLKEIDACSNIREIFRQLRFHLRWDDHLILTAILDRLDSEECEELLGKFQSKIDCQMKLEQIFEESKKQKQEVPKGFDKMVAIVNKKYSRITKEEYDQLKCFIAEHCGVDSYVLSPFLNMSPSSLLLEWLVASTAITYMVETATKHKHIFIKEGFVFLQIATTVILDCRSDTRMMESGNGDQTVEQSLEVPLLNQLHKISFSVDPKDRDVTFSTLRRIFDNIVQHPNDDKYCQIKLTSKTFTNKVWQYPAGQELMKMSGWVVEGDHVRLKDESRVKIVLILLESFCEQTGIKCTRSISVTTQQLSAQQFQELITAVFDNSIARIQELLKCCTITRASRIFSEDGLSINLMAMAIVLQKTDVVKILVKKFSVDPYELYYDGEKPCRCSINIFDQAPQSFIIDFLKISGVRVTFKADGYTLLHTAVLTCCFNVVRFLVEECEGIDVNITDDNLRTPLHTAYLVGHRHISEYLIKHGADITAMDIYGHVPYEYIDSDPDLVAISQYVQKKRKIHQFPFSVERLYYFQLLNLGIDIQRVVDVTMEKFPSLRDNQPTQLSSDSNQDTIVREITQYITKKSIGAESWQAPQSLEQRLRHISFS